MALTHVLVIDDELGKISEEQRDGGVAGRQTDLVTPEFAACGNCGTKGVRVETAEELEDGLATALDHEGPALVEVLTNATPGGRVTGAAMSAGESPTRSNEGCSDRPVLRARSENGHEPVTGRTDESIAILSSGCAPSSRCCRTIPSGRSVQRSPQEISVHREVKST